MDLPWHPRLRLPDPGPLTSRVRTAWPRSELQVVRERSALAGLDEALQAEQEVRPPRAAVRHELGRVAPVRMGEEDHGLTVGCGEVEADMVPDLLVRAADTAPAHLPAGVEGRDLHDGGGLGVIEEELELGILRSTAPGRRRGSTSRRFRRPWLRPRTRGPVGLR